MTAKDLATILWLHGDREVCIRVDGTTKPVARAEYKEEDEKRLIILLTED